MNGGQAGPGMPDVDPPEDPISRAFSEAAKTVGFEAYLRSVHGEALKKLRRAGFEEGLSRSTTRILSGVMRTLFPSISWQSPGGKREVYPEVVTQLYVQAEKGLLPARNIPPEDHGATALQLEILRGLERIFDATNPSVSVKPCGLWLREFASDGSHVIRVPLMWARAVYPGADRTICLVAELRFWEGSPGSSHAKPI